MDRENCGLRFSKYGTQNGAFRLGYQEDSGYYYCVLAHTEDGIIPAKAQIDVEACWYPFGGEEKECHDFEWISSKGRGQVYLSSFCGEDAPEDALLLGSQEDGDYYLAIAHTDEGQVPAKSRDGACWYPFGGEEHETDNFSFVCAKRPVLQYDRDNCGLRFTEACEGVYDHAFRLGHQYDSGDYYCVLARTEDGLIPGKAKHGVEECWYPYGGEEKTCSDFEWISASGHGVMLRANCGDVPNGALCIGRQEDGEYFVAVAHTEEGDIPAKARDGNCWFPFGGEERETDNFSYVISRFGNLQDGQRIHLESQHGGNVRVADDDTVDGHGGHGSWATFIVQKNEHDGTVRLQNENRPNRFLAIRKCGLTTGSGGRYCVFKPNFHKDGTVSFASVNFPNRHIGINSNKEARNPKKTGTGINARFNIIVKED